MKEYYGLSESMRSNFNDYKIELTEERFFKADNKKSWITESKTTKIVTFDEYFNYISSVGFFKNTGGREKIEKTYTQCGYIPTKIISISPSKDIRVVRTFKINK